MISERITTDPETGEPQPPREVSDTSREMRSIRRAAKQARDSKWNVEAARDESPDADRKHSYKEISAELDAIHAKLASAYEALKGTGTLEAPPRREQSHAHGYNMPGGIRPFLQPRPNHGARPPKPDPDGDTLVVPRGRTATAQSRTSTTDVYASADVRDGRAVLQEAEAVLSTLRNTQWFPNDQTSWAPPITRAPKGGVGSDFEAYGLGDRFRGAVRATTSPQALGELVTHPRDVAKAVSSALEELYGSATAREFPWYWHTSGMPDDLPEGLVVTQEEVYYAIRKLAGEYAVTGDYYDQVVDELEKLGHPVTTVRPHTLERRQHTA